MDTLAVILGLGNVACGLVSIAAAIPLLRGKIKRNGLYGARFPEAFRSEDAWRKINRFGAERLIAWSIPPVVLGLVSAFLPLSRLSWAVWPVGLAPLILFIPAFECWRFARRFGPEA